MSDPRKPEVTVTVKYQGKLIRKISVFLASVFRQNSSNHAKKLRMQIDGAWGPCHGYTHFADLLQELSTSLAVLLPDAATATPQPVEAPHCPFQRGDVVRVPTEYYQGEPVLFQRTWVKLEPLLGADGHWWLCVYLYGIGVQHVRADQCTLVERPEPLSHSTPQGMNSCAS